jgi:UDP-glucose 4-epimerase
MAPPRRPAFRIAMTGAGGFLGAHLLARFVGAGMSVTIIGPDTGESRYTAWMVAAGDVRFVRCSAGFADAEVDRALEEADALVLSGFDEPWASSGIAFNPADVEHTVLPLARLVGSFARRGKHLILAGSDSVYGAPERTPVRESDPTRPLTGLGLINLACEQAVRVCSEVDATASILRYATIYGPGETATRAVPNLIRAALAGRSPVLEDDGLDEHDYVHVADAVDATVSALRRRANGVYNVGTGVGTTMAELADLVVWLTGCSATPIGRPREDHPSHSSVVLDTSRARLDLAFEARHALPYGLREEVGWFKAVFRSNLKTAA